MAPPVRGCSRESTAPVGLPSHATHPPIQPQTRRNAGSNTVPPTHCPASGSANSDAASTNPHSGVSSSVASGDHRLTVPTVSEVIHSEKVMATSPAKSPSGTADARAVRTRSARRRGARRRLSGSRRAAGTVRSPSVAEKDIQNPASATAQGEMPRIRAPASPSEVSGSADAAHSHDRYTNPSITAARVADGGNPNSAR